MTRAHHWCLCRWKLQKNCGLHSFLFDTRHRNVNHVLTALICENFSQIAKRSSCFKGKLGNFPAIVQQKNLYPCVRIFMQIKVTKELWAPLISIWQSTPKCWPYFISTDMRKYVLNRKNSALFKCKLDNFLPNAQQKNFYLFVHRLYLCRWKLQKNCRLTSL